MTQQQSAVLMVVVGILLGLVSLFADALGVGATPGFGWKQMAGVGVGVALAAFGVWRRR